MYETTAFLCGYFHRNHNVLSEQFAPEEWNVVQFSDDEAASLKRTFYEEYIDFFADKCVMMKNVVDKDLRLPFVKICMIIMYLILQYTRCLLV